MGWPVVRAVRASCFGAVRCCELNASVLWLVHLGQIEIICSAYSGWLGDLQSGQVWAHEGSPCCSRCILYAPLKSVIRILRSIEKPLPISGCSFHDSRYRLLVWMERPLMNLLMLSLVVFSGLKFSRMVLLLS